MVTHPHQTIRYNIPVKDDRRSRKGQVFTPLFWRRARAQRSLTVTSHSDSWWTGTVEIGSEQYHITTVRHYLSKGSTLVISFNLLDGGDVLAGRVFAVEGDPKDVKGSHRRAVAAFVLALGSTSANDLRRERRSPLSAFRWLSVELQAARVHEAQETRSFDPEGPDPFSVLPSAPSDRETMILAALSRLGTSYRYDVVGSPDSAHAWFMRPLDGDDHHAPARVARAFVNADRTDVLFLFDGDDGTLQSFQGRDLLRLLEAGKPRAERELEPPAWP